MPAMNATPSASVSMPAVAPGSASRKPRASAAARKAAALHREVIAARRNYDDRYAERLALRDSGEYWGMDELDHWRHEIASEDALHRLGEAAEALLHHQDVTGTVGLLSEGILVAIPGLTPEQTEGERSNPGWLPDRLVIVDLAMASKV